VDLQAAASNLILNGQGGTNTLVGPNANTVWNITSLNGGTVGSTHFSNFQNLTGGTANDVFVIGNGKDVSGIITSGGGNDTISYAPWTTVVTVDLATGTATGTAGISGIENFTGGSGNDHITGDANANVINGGGGNDVLVGGGGADLFVVGPTQAAATTISDTGPLATIEGPNAANVWAVTGADAGNLNGIAFTGIANLVGGTGTDDFKINSAGGLVGTVNGGPGAAVNTLDYSGRTTPILVNMATGTATSIHGFSNISALIGSTSTSNKLIGPSAANTWTLTGANAGTVGAFGFSAIQNLTGGTSTDTFNFNPGGSVSGTINGGGSTNTLNYSAFGTPVTVNLAANTATGTGGIANVGKLVGSGLAGDLLVGPNTTNAWSITGNNAGTLNTFAFSGIANLTGGSGMDVFKFSNGKSVSGSIDGGGGGDWLDYSLYTTPVAVNLSTGTATAIGGTVANIQDVRGGSGGNTLTGDSAGNILIGGTGADTINGGSGASILIGDKGADNVVGGSGNDIIIGGWTNYDASAPVNDLALEKILAEWQSADTFATRVADIKAGTGLTGGNKLVWGSTVHDDGVANTLTGLASSTTNWFFKGTKDTITDLEAGDQVN
jgi:hypothetical protein